VRPRSWPANVPPVVVSWWVDRVGLSPSSSHIRRPTAGSPNRAAAPMLPDTWKAALLSVLLAVAGCTDKNCSPCRPGTYPSNPSQQCSACVPCPDGGTDADSGSASIWCAAKTPSTDGSTESSLGGTACGDSAFFTACVQTCGETNTREGTAASCLGGKYHCDAPRTPATDCGPGTWTSPQLPCGPWVDGYDCGGGCAVCDSSRGWTCGACPDASAASGL
jgi:hypothetical protein